MFDNDAKSVTINGVKYIITSEEMDEMRAIFNRIGPPKGVGEALNAVLVKTGKIPNDPKTKNLAWYPVAKIVGHKIPSQTRNIVKDEQLEEQKSIDDYDDPTNSKREDFEQAFQELVENMISPSVSELVEFVENIKDSPPTNLEELKPVQLKMQEFSNQYNRLIISLEAYKMGMEHVMHAREVTKNFKPEVQ